MGWSCNSAAGKVQDAWFEACTAQGGTMNTFTTPKGRYFFETSSVEHRCGAITGTIRKWIGDTNFTQRSGSFRIEGDGTVTRAPKFLKDAAKNAKPVQPVLSLRERGLGSDGKPLFQLI